MFVCPSCKGLLSSLDYGFMCPKCSHYWPIKDGIPCFTDREYVGYEGLSNDEMRKLNEVAKEKGWLKALHESCINSYLLNYIADEDRANWHNVLPNHNLGAILDLGAGWGNISIPLSRICKTITAGDASFERIRFIAIRARQSNVNTLKAVCLDAAYLPFPDSYFDLVVLNGVLEWAGVQRAPSNPMVIQKKCLHEVYRVLKKDGVIYIGTENRYSASYLLKGRWKYETYTHSVQGYRSMLIETGFDSVEFYYVFPHYTDPTRIVPLNDRKVIRYFLKNVLSNTWSLNRRKSLQLTLARVGCRLGLEEYIWSSLGIIAIKGER